MIVDKPDWVTHGPATSIVSIDVHPASTRFATAGSDQKVRIWNMGPVLDVNEETGGDAGQPPPPKQLAMLADHYAPINVARFSRSGRFIASGADDKLVCIYELRAGAGSKVFGSREGPSAENWKHVYALRGHANNVLDVAWAPEDRWLASASIDNQIVIWDGASGARVRTLEGHSSYVKGLAWDPVGTYLATQSDDKSIIIWKTDTWQAVTAITEPFQRWISLAVSMRLDWAPDGAAVVGVNSYRSPHHTAALLPRGTWGRDDANPVSYLVGHKNAVLVARYSPRMFKLGGKLVPCLALGSQDQKLTVWLGRERPVYVGHRFFKQGVGDIAWSPDGLTLLAVSTDGSMTTLQFTVQDLAPLATQQEMNAHMAKIYGDSRARTAVFAESAAQLALEAEASRDEFAAANGALPSAALDARLGPGGSDELLARPSGAAAAAAPQKRRISPLTVGGAGSAAAAAEPSQAAADGQQATAPFAAPAAKRVRLEPAPAAPAANGSTGVPPPGQQQQQHQARQTPLPPPAVQRPAPARMPPASAPAAPAAAAASASAAAGAQQTAAPRLPLPEPAAVLSVQLGTEIGIVAGESAARALEVINTRDRSGRPVARLSSTAGGRCLWTDELPGVAALATGSLRFVAVALQGGSLQVFTAGGRRLLPPVQLAGPPAFLAADSGWRLLSVAAGGDFAVWDLQALSAQLAGSAAPLLSLAPSRVVGMRLSAAGLPLAVTSDGGAFSFHRGLCAWMRVADAAFPSSPYHSILQGPTGELGRLQAEAVAGAAGARRDGVLTSLAAPPARGAAIARSHLEANMSAALALQSPAEYKRWLLTYARLLAGEADEVRLRELCSELLGLHPLAGSNAAAAPGISGATAAAGPPQQWQRSVLGLDKRKLLQQEVLRDIGRNRANQRLVNEFRELLDAYSDDAAPC